MNESAFNVDVDDSTRITIGSAATRTGVTAVI
jgi:hypothetical protein